MTLPTKLTLNAWTGSQLEAEVDPQLASRILRLPMLARSRHLPAPLVPLTDWHHPEVGWGLVLPDNPDVPPTERWRADDTPEPIRRLVAARATVAGAVPVFRVGLDWTPGQLTYYTPSGQRAPAALAAARFGTAAGHVPRYLLILGGPDRIAWDVQYDLQGSCFVGRLDLDEAGLDRYVTALLNGWTDRPANRANTLVWSVDHGGGDITELMRDAIGKPLHQRFASDEDVRLAAGAHYLGGAAATQAALADGVAAHRPLLITTTSHGATMPLNDPPAMLRQLGLPVDHNYSVLDPAPFLRDGACAGALWLAQACCSAGSSANSAFAGILTPGSKADNILSAVAGCGNTIAPLPKALLGCAKPLAAFVGHVEPTFDWTMRDPVTRQFLTNSILEAFHRRLYTGQPIGMALDAVRETGSSILTSYMIAQRHLVDNQDKTQLSRLLALSLAATDHSTMVLLGDPTVSFYP